MDELKKIIEEQQNTIDTLQTQVEDLEYKLNQLYGWVEGIMEKIHYYP